MTARRRGFILIMLFLAAALLAVFASITPRRMNIFANDDEVITVCKSGPPTCDYSIIQQAVDAADFGETIKIAAGIYSDLTTASGPQEVVYINKPVSIVGGYTESFNDPPDFEMNKTILDAQKKGSTIKVEGFYNPIIEGLHITGGSYLFMDEPPVTKAGIQVQQGSVTLKHNLIYGNDHGLSVNEGMAEVYENVFHDNANNGMYYHKAHGIVLGNVIANNGLRGVSASRGDFLIRDNLVKSNMGGGISIGYAQAEISHNTIVSNSTDYSGAGISITGANVSIKNNDISHNLGGENHQGGGLYSVQSRVIARNNLFIANSAGYGGGYYGKSSDVSLDGNSFFENEARSREGGAINIYDSSSSTRRIEITNNIIARNRAARGGSGLHIRGSSAELNHNTFSQNLGGEGIGLYAAHQSNLNLRNTIVASHTIGIFAGNYGSVDIDGTLWGSGPWANLGDWAGIGSIVTGTVNLWEEPSFVDPIMSDFHLLANSAAIDAGVRTATRSDYDGEQRDELADIGADEYWSPEALSYIYLPTIMGLEDPCHGFIDTFENPDSGWPSDEDEFVRRGYIDGEYQIASKSSEYFYLALGSYCSHHEFFIEVDARWNGPTGASYGILFGISENSSAYYLFDVNSDFQQYRLVKFTPDEVEIIAGPSNSLAINTGNSVNRIGVRYFREIEYYELQFTVNGVDVSGLDLNSETITRSWIALVSMPYINRPESDARFDNFRLMDIYVDVGDLPEVNEFRAIEHRLNPVLPGVSLRNTELIWRK